MAGFAHNVRMQALKGGIFTPFEVQDDGSVLLSDSERRNMRVVFRSPLEMLRFAAIMAIGKGGSH